MEPHLREGEQVPDLIFFHELLQRRLGAVYQQLAEVDYLLETEQLEDSQARQQRDRAASELVNLFVRFRYTVKGVCGADLCDQVLALEGPVPKDPVVLQRLAHNAVTRLREGALETPEADLGGVAVYSDAWIEMLEKPLRGLDAALAHLSDQNQDTFERQAAKNALMGEYDKAYLTCARLLENLFQHVGMDELAGRVRPAQRSPTAGPPDGEEAPILEAASPPREVDGFPGEPGSEVVETKSLASRLLSALS